MKDFITANGGLIATVIMVLMAVNALIVGLHSALEKLKDATSTDVDNKVYDLTGTIATWIQKVLEIIGAYKPAPKQDDASAAAPKS